MLLLVYIYTSSTNFKDFFLLLRTLMRLKTNCKNRVLISVFFSIFFKFSYVIISLGYEFEFVI